MFRSIGSVTVLALLMVGCWGWGEFSGAPPPPPPRDTVGGTVSGLVGSGLTLEICSGSRQKGSCHSPLQVGANGAFILDSVYPAGYSGPDYVLITNQPNFPPQWCVINDAAVRIHANVTVTCATFLYVTNAADNTLSAYSVDATTGALTVIDTPIATGAPPHTIFGFKNPASGYVFVGNEDSNDVSAFTVNNTTGALTAAPGSPFAAGTDPQAMALYGSSIYVANHGGSNDISAFFTDLTPVSGSPFPAGGNPLSLALWGGKFLYTANPDATNPSISGFSIDPASGTLTPLSGSPFPLPVSHYITTTGNYLYVTSGANVVGYSIDANTGALTALAGFPVSAGANAYSITIDPTNQFLYVTNDGAANVSGFTLNASTGALTPMAGSPFPAGNHPEFIATF